MDIPLLTREDGFCPIGYDPLTINTVTGIRRYIKFLDEVDEDGIPHMHVVTVQPVQDILDQNAREKFNAKGTFTKRGTWGAKAASIPIQMLDEWGYHADGTKLDEDETAAVIKRNLNSNEFSKLRTGEFNL